MNDDQRHGASAFAAGRRRRLVADNEETSMLRPALTLIALGAALIAGPALAQTASAPPVPAAPPAPPYGAPITLAQAKTAIAAAEAEARKQGWLMVIVVVEPNGALVMSEKMDGAQYGS